MAQLIRPRLPILQRNHPLADGLVFSIPFFERGGTKARSTSKTVSATLENGPVWSRYRELGQCVDYSASNHRLNLGNNPDLMQKNFSLVIECVLKSTHQNGSTRREIVRKDTPYIFDFNSNGMIEFAINNGTWQVMFSSKNSWAADTRFQIVFVNDESIGRQIWVNGIQDSGSAFINPSVNNGSTFYIFGDGSNGFSGYSFHALWYKRGLRRKEIRALYDDPYTVYRPQRLILPATYGVTRSPYDAKPLFKPKLAVLNRVHPLARHVVWAAAPDSNNTHDLVTRRKGTRIGTAGRWIGVTPIGEALESANTSTGGAYWPFNEQLRTITRDHTVVVFAAIDSLPSYGHLLSIPNGSGWVDPYTVITLQAHADNTQGFVINANGGIKDECQSDTGFYVTDGRLRMYAYTRNQQTVKFYRNGVPYGATKTLTGNSDIVWVENKVNLLQRSNTSTGEGCDGRTPFAAIFNRYLTPKEITSLFLNPWILITPKGFQYGKTSITFVELLDSGASSELLDIITSLSVSETTNGVESTDIISQLALSDSISSFEALSVFNQIAVSENSNISSEALDLLVQIALSDSATVSEVLNLLITLAVSDSILGTDVISILASIVISDTGSLSNETLAVVTAIAVSETTNSIEALSILVSIIINDSAGSSEVLSILSDFLLSEAGSGIETLTAGAYINVGDSGTLASDILNILALIALSESSNVTEALQILVNVAMSDSAVCNEALYILADIAISDTSVAAEVLSLLAQVMLSDSGSSIDMVSITSTLALSDLGVAVELLQIITSLAVTDESISSEAISILAQIVVAESVLSDEALSLLVSLAVQETAFGNDALLALVSIALSDTTIGAEVLNVLIVYGLYERGLGLFNKSDNLYNRNASGLYNKSS